MEIGPSEMRTESVSLLSLPNELLLELIEWEPSSLHIQRRAKKIQNARLSISSREFSLLWFGDPGPLYTRPWSIAHHRIALPLSQTCRRLRELMLASVWAEVGLNSLEDLCKLRRGLRLLPERARLISRLEWRWCKSHPAHMDHDYRRVTSEKLSLRLAHEPLEKLLQPSLRWPRQLASTKEVLEAMGEVICQLSRLDTLLWGCPIFPMESHIVEFLASKLVPLKSLQVDMGGLRTEYALETVQASYWRLAGQLEKLSVTFRMVRGEAMWTEEEMTRWANYDDELAGLDAFVKEWHQKDLDSMKAAGWPLLSIEDRNQRLAQLTLSERQSVIAYKTIITACESNNLRSLAIEPLWALSVPRLVPYWVKLEEFHLAFERVFAGDTSGIDWIREHAHLGKEYLRNDESNKSVAYDWALYAEWHRGAAAIRPAVYHAARHRKAPGPLTVQDVQAIGEQGANYPASLFYPHFRDSVIAQRVLDEWQALVARGEGERVVCPCAECQ